MVPPAAGHRAIPRRFEALGDETAILVGLTLTRRSERRVEVWEADGEEPLAELGALAASAGARVAGQCMQSRPAPEAATLIGAGKLEEVAALAGAERANLVIFDQDLSPTQLRNIERALPCRVLDRTQLILDIFASRARTREGQLQVELAQLSYLLPRLTGRGVAMSRLGGGIGTRGPGETQLETDRRRISRRIQKIREQLESVRSNRSTQRRQRQDVPLATLALVGYTNAGKSTLFNRLTGAGVTADPRLFATLDPTVRQMTLPSRRRVLISDTVGFIRHLPATLIKAFRATLEEVAEASLLLHVVDGSSPRAALDRGHVRGVLTEIGASATPELLVVNKLDRLPESEAETACQRLVESRPVPAAGISARTGQGVDRLLGVIDELVPLDPVSRAVFRFPLAEAARIHTLHERGKVYQERYEGESCVIEADVPQSLLRRLEKFVTR